MLLSQPFKTGLIKFYHNSQRMSDSFHHISESYQIKKLGSKTYSCRSAKFWNFCGGIHMHSTSTYDVTKSYLTRVFDEKIRKGYITMETRVVM